MLKRVLPAIALTCALSGITGLMGCDRTVSEDTKTKTRSDGSTVTDTKKKVETDDGSVKTTTEHKVDNSMSK